MPSEIDAAEQWMRERGWMLDKPEREAELERRSVPKRSRPQLHRLAATLTTAELAAAASPNSDRPTSSQLVDGASFALDAPTGIEAVWGDTDGRVLWAAGEPLMIVAPQGVGKTTLAQRIALGRIGLCPQLLGLPVARDEQRVLYIAADRPRQAQRSLARMVDDRDRDALRDRLIVWRGLLPFALSDPKVDPEALAALCRDQHAGTLIVDCLKDVASDLSREETGQRVNLAFQAAVAAGVEVVALHHQRKPQADNKTPKTLGDVYGSTWLTASMGSVILLWGEPGDILVELRHLKQPLEEVGPLTIAHDHHRGLPTVHEPADLKTLLRQAGADGLTVADAARATLGKSTPTRNDIEKSRRRLAKLADQGLALHIPSTIPTDPGRYVYNADAEQERERA